MKRLFIAIDLPDTLRRGLEGMGASLPGSRPTPLEQLHITLHFLGDQEGNRILDIHEALGRIRHLPFSLQLRGLGLFPGRGAPRILWAGITPVTEISDLRRRISAELDHFGFPREKKKFHPHITLARLRNCPTGRLQDFLMTNGILESPPFRVEAFHLFSSRLSPDGARHYLEESYPLTSP